MEEPTPKEVVPFVPVQKRVVEWGPDGQPILTAQPVLTKQHLQSIYFVVAAQPYVVEDPLDPDFGKYDGMTIAEVMVRKQALNAAKSGNPDDIEKVMDRLLGKPKQVGESVKISATYEDVLKEIERKAAGGAPIIDVAAAVESSVFGDLA